MSRTIKNETRHAVRADLLVMMLGAMLAGCGGGGGSDPAPSPSPPPPPSGSEVPPLAAPVSLNDNHRVGALHWDDGDTATGGTGQTVAGLDCLTNMPEDYHVHTHLSIFLNGEALAVPANIGINPSPRCFYTIHTHDHSGKLHIEAAAAGTYTLGQFFQVWGQTLDSTTLADLTGMPIVIYVTDEGDTAATQVTSGWSDIELKSHREITIQVGTDITEIPQFTWSAN